MASKSVARKPRCAAQARERPECTCRASSKFLHHATSCVSALCVDSPGRIPRRCATRGPCSPAHAAAPEDRERACNKADRLRSSFARSCQSRMATRPVSQSTSTSYLRSPANTVTRPPFEPPSGKKRIAPDLVAHEIALRGEELHADAARQRAHAIVAVDGEALVLEVEHETRVRVRFATASLARIAKAGGDLRAAALRSSVVDGPSSIRGITIAEMSARIESTMRSSISVNPDARIPPLSPRGAPIPGRVAFRFKASSWTGPRSGPRRLPCRRRRAR